MDKKLNTNTIYRYNSTLDPIKKFINGAKGSENILFSNLLYFTHTPNKNKTLLEEELIQ